MLPGVCPDCFLIHELPRSVVVLQAACRRSMNLGNAWRCLSLVMRGRLRKTRQAAKTGERPPAALLAPTTFPF
ncbi:hypothetical protein D9X30_2379 [Cupriavidus sp. U2]|nr:hypothetical protein D9X30_2379 [Cupriavidus sp. U2]